MQRIEVLKLAKLISNTHWSVSSLKQYSELLRMSDNDVLTGLEVLQTHKAIKFKKIPWVTEPVSEFDGIKLIERNEVGIMILKINKAVLMDIINKPSLILNKELRTYPTKKLINFNGRESIRSLACVRSTDTSPMQIVINGNYKKPITVGQHKKTWGLLLKVADGEQIHDRENNNKSSLDNLNTNRGCKIYANTGYHITKILSNQNGVIRPLVKIESIDQSVFTRRQNMQL